MSKKIVFTIWHDDCVDDPCEYGWKVYSFNRRHANFKHPDEIEEDESIRAKLANGLAFPLSYFEHGQCLWAIQHELPPMANCRFDSVGYAGVVVWEEDEDDIGAKTVEDRRADARAFIERFTEWCNGEIYGYTVRAYKACGSCGQDEEIDEIDLPSCGGYYASDIDGMVYDMRETVEINEGDEIVFKEDNGYGLADECRRRWEEEKTPA